MVESANESELANAVGRANLTGLFCCPHTGVALAVLEKLVKSGKIKKNNRVIVISTANGLNLQNFFTGITQINLKELLLIMPMRQWIFLLIMRKLKKPF